MKATVMSLTDLETAMHESTEAEYTKKREGEFVGAIETAYGSVGGGTYSGDMKKKQDPVEVAEDMGGQT